VRQTERETESKQTALARSDDRTGDRPELGLPDEPAEGRQRRLGSGGRLGDGVDGATDERAPAQCQGQSPKGARSRSQQYRAQAVTTARRGQATIGSLRGQRIAESSRSTENDSLEATANRDVQADQCLQSPAAEPLCH
jgi:hypothetical protein